MKNRKTAVKSDGCFFNKAKAAKNDGFVTPSTTWLTRLDINVLTYHIGVHRRVRRLAVHAANHMRMLVEILQKLVSFKQTLDRFLPKFDAGRIDGYLLIGIYRYAAVLQRYGIAV